MQMRPVVKTLATSAAVVVYNTAALAGLTIPNGGSVRRVVINSQASSDIITILDNSTSPATVIAEYVFGAATTAPFIDTIPDGLGYRFSDGLSVKAATGSATTTIGLITGE